MAHFPNLASDSLAAVFSVRAGLVSSDRLSCYTLNETPGPFAQHRSAGRSHGNHPCRTWGCHDRPIQFA